MKEIFQSDGFNSCAGVVHSWQNLNPGSGIQYLDLETVDGLVPRDEIVSLRESYCLKVALVLIGMEIVNFNVVDGKFIISNTRIDLLNIEAAPR